jgi:hypothetical protein
MYGVFNSDRRRQIVRRHVMSVHGLDGRTRNLVRHPIRSASRPELETRHWQKATTFHRRQLLPERQALQDQFPMSTERQRQRASDHDEQLKHASIVAGVGPKIKRDELWRGSGSTGSLHRRASEESGTGVAQCISSHIRHGTIPCSGRGSCGSMAMYSRRCPSGSRKNTEAAGIQAKTMG